MKIHILIAFLFCLVFKLTGTAQAKNIEVRSETNVLERYAFIVGNDHYKDAAITTLASCRLDAERFYNFVTSEQGYAVPIYNTQVLLDASKEQIISQFEDFLQNIKNPQTSSVYFYFSGHGIQGALLPTDFNVLKPESQLSYNWIKTAITKAEITSPLLVIDACYSGSLISAKNSDRVLYNALSSIKGEMLPSNFTVFTATSAYRVTPAGRHSSAYTRNFLKAVRSQKSDNNNDGIITAGELSNAILALLQTSNAPQFSGDKSLNIATLTSRFTERKTIAKIKRSVKTSQLIAWRDRVEHATKIQLQLEVKQLQQSNYLVDKSKLGFMYRKGLGVKQDANTAIQHFILGALEKDAFALYNLGFMYYHGMGVTANITKATALYQKAAGLNDAFAQYNLGCLYLSKKEHPNIYNEEQGISYYRRSAKQGFSHASYKLGKLYLIKAEEESRIDNKTVFKNQAIKYFEKAASQNHTEAQFLLGGLYEDVKNTEYNKERANYWLKQACNSNHLIACKKLMLIAVN